MDRTNGSCTCAVPTNGAGSSPSERGDGMWMVDVLGGVVVGAALAILPGLAAWPSLAARAGMSETSVRPAELELLRRIDQVGGRYTFRPDGESRIAYRVFEEGVVSVVLSLSAKGFVRLDPDATEITSVQGQRNRVAAIAAEVTEAGRRLLAGFL